jgi:hypothetical protein
MATTTTAGLGWVLIADAGTIGNLLTDNVATGTDTLADATGFVTAACTIESSTEQAWEGTRSLKMTATGGTAAVRMGGSSIVGTIPVVPGRTYTAIAHILGTGTPTFVRRMVIYWWTAAGNVAASTATVSGDTSAVTTSWQRFGVTGVAPGNAAFASFTPTRGSGGASGEIEYLDGISFHAGAGGLYVPPGVPVPNLGSRANPANTAQVQVWNPGNSTWITV